MPRRSLVTQNNAAPQLGPRQYLDVPPLATAAARNRLDALARHRHHLHRLSDAHVPRPQAPDVHGSHTPCHAHFVRTPPWPAHRRCDHLPTSPWPALTPRARDSDAVTTTTGRSQPHNRRGVVVTARPPRARNRDVATITTRRSQPYDRHSVIVTPRPLVLTVAPAWLAPRPHPALGAHALGRRLS